jgi:hypothetical protein
VFPAGRDYAIPSSSHKKDRRNLVLLCFPRGRPIVTSSKGQL